MSIKSPQKQEAATTRPPSETCFQLFQVCVRKYLSFEKKKVDSFLSAPVYEIFMTVITFVVLYADDIRVLAIDKAHDEGYYYFMLSCFFLFFIEIVLLSLSRSGYIFSFFFWMDLLSTFSTVMEIPLVMNDILGIDIFDPSKSAKLAKYWLVFKI